MITLKAKIKDMATNNNFIVNAILTFVLSVFVSFRRLRLILIYFDGKDWMHKWFGGLFVSNVPSLDPTKMNSENLKLFISMYKPRIGDVIVELGAGNGTETYGLSKMVGNKGKVYAIEPDPESFRRLVKLISIGQLTNVEPLNVAISDQVGFAWLVENKEGSIGNWLANSSLESSFSRQVPTTTLDSLFTQYNLRTVDYLKINIEGSEREALKGFATHIDAVRNYCISCHDFLGRDESKTYDFVRNWLTQNNITPQVNPYEFVNNYRHFYVFAKNEK